MRGWFAEAMGTITRGEIVAYITGQDGLRVEQIALNMTSEKKAALEEPPFFRGTRRAVRR